MRSLNKKTWSEKRKIQNNKDPLSRVEKGLRRAIEGPGRAIPTRASRKMEADREEPERGKGAFLTKKKRRPTKRGSPTKTNSKKFWKQEKRKNKAHRKVRRE